MMFPSGAMCESIRQTQSPLSPPPPHRSVACHVTEVVHTRAFSSRFHDPCWQAGFNPLPPRLAKSELTHNRRQNAAWRGEARKLGVIRHVLPIILSLTAAGRREATDKKSRGRESLPDHAMERHGGKGKGHFFFGAKRKKEKKTKIQHTKWLAVYTRENK